MSLTKDMEQAVSNLRTQGIKFTIVTEVDRKLELHREIEMLNGNSRVLFIAEIDSFGNVVEWGPGLRHVGGKALSPVYNADGEEV